MSRREITLEFKAQSRFFLTLWFGMLHKPVNNRVNICGVFARDHEAANFPISNWFQIPAHQRKLSPKKRVKENKIEGGNNINIIKLVYSVIALNNQNTRDVNLTFGQSTLVWTEPLPCQSCSPAPIKGYHSMMACSANHEVHFLIC